jgi:hypothetical protein
MKFLEVIDFLAIGLASLFNTIGCGGSSTGVSGAIGSQPIRFNIAWGATSMATAALSSALSAILTLQDRAISRRSSTDRPARHLTPSLTFLRNCIAGVSAAGVIQYGRLMQVTFTFYDPLNTTAPGGTRTFSLTGDLDGNPANTVVWDAYDVAGNMIEKYTTADIGGEVLTITMPKATINKVVFLGAPGFNDGVGLDNVTFGPVVPVTP